MNDNPPAGLDPAQLGQIFHRVRSIAQRLDELGDRLGRVEESRAVPGAAQPGPAAAEPGLPEWSWVHLDPAERGRRLVELHQWVAWLVSTYAIPSGQLPDCWYQHSAMVADLGALHAGWAAAYLDPKAEPDRPSRWHDTLERTLRRLREWDRHGCGRSGRHAEQIADMAAEHDSNTPVRAVCRTARRPESVTPSYYRAGQPVRTYAHGRAPCTVARAHPSCRPPPVTSSR